MPRVAYFDCPSGAAGDMIMGALVDAGAPLEALRAELAKLGLAGWDLAARPVRKGAFRATKVDVLIDEKSHRHPRTLADILTILDASALAKIFGFFALTMAAVNIFGGFLVTQRMLGMYKKREAPKK